MKRFLSITTFLLFILLPIVSQDLSEPIEQESISEYNHAEGYWNKQNLTYYVYNSPLQISEQITNNTIQDSFNKWATVTNFTFTQIYESTSADITLQWVTGDHGCGEDYIFGPNNYQIAHTKQIYSSSTHLMSKAHIHFDSDRNWTIDGQNYDLRHTITHEIGHALGLAESYTEGAIMFWEYNNAIDLTADDISGIWTKYSCPLNTINGDAVISHTSVYSVPNIPNVNGLNVIWSVSDSYYQQNCVQQNFPNTRQCSITRTSGHDLNNGILTANIKYNGNIVGSITKNIDAYSGFKGTFNNGQTVKQINIPSPLYVRPNTNACISSKNLIGSTITFGSNPSYISHDSTNGNLYFTMPYANYSSTVIHIDCTNGDSYNLTLVTTTNSNLLTLIVSKGQIEVSLIPMEEIEKRQDMNVIEKEYNNWHLEVLNASTGETLFSKKGLNQTTIINTMGWKPGIYIVHASNGNEVLAEKAVIKQ